MARPKPTTVDRTGPSRVRLLLPWLNGHLAERSRFPHRLQVSTIRRLLADFVASFDGSPEAAKHGIHVVAVPDDTADRLDEQELDALEYQLTVLLAQGFSSVDSRPPADLSLPIGSLRMSVRSAGRKEPAKPGTIAAAKTNDHRKYAAALREWLAPGAYRLHVHGAMMELVPFLLTHLLMASNMVEVKRCERIGCENFVVPTKGRGAPFRFCSIACRDSNQEPELTEQVTKKKPR